MGAGARLPERSVALRPSLAAEVGGRGRDPPREQDPGSLTAAAPSPSAPFPGPSPKRLSKASTGPARLLPLAVLGVRGKAAAPGPPTPPVPRARTGPAHACLTLCRRRSCCRPVRRRYRSPPFAVSAPRGTRVSEKGPRNITPPAPPPGLSAAPPDRKSHARARARTYAAPRPAWSAPGPGAL